MKKSKSRAFISLLIFLGLWATALALDKEKEFKEISRMGEKDLTARAVATLEKKYRGEDWEKYDFPKYVYIKKGVMMGYKIAVKEPQLLAKFPCYCLCDVMGHKNLLYCFIEKGVPGGKFDDHASTCNICYTEAMRIFLWNELGVAEAEMLKSLEKIYGK